MRAEWVVIDETAIWCSFKSLDLQIFIQAAYEVDLSLNRVRVSFYDTSNSFNVTLQNIQVMFQSKIWQQT